MASRLNKHKHQTILAQVYVLKGRTVQMVGHADSATYFFNKAHRLCRTLPYNSGMVDIDLQRGIYYTLGLADGDSLGAGEQLLKNVAANATPCNRAKAYLNLAYLYLDSRREQEGRQMLDSMCAIMEKCKNHYMLIGIDYDRLIAHFAHQGDSTQMLKYVGMKEQEVKTDKENSHNMTITESIVDKRLKNMEQSFDQRLAERNEQMTRGMTGMLALMLGISLATVYFVFRAREICRKSELAEQKLNEQAEHVNQLQKRQDHTDDLIKMQIMAQTPLQQKTDELKFAMEFQRAYPTFSLTLNALASNLGSRERILCMLIALRKSNDEAALFLGISTSSVRQMRYRVKKKMNLSNDTTLEDVLKV